MDLAFDCISRNEEKNDDTEEEWATDDLSMARREFVEFLNPFEVPKGTRGTHFLGRLRYKLSRKKNKELYALRIFRFVDADTCPFVNFNERNDPGRGLLRYVMDFDAAVTDDVIRSTIRFIARTLTEKFRRDAAIEVVACRVPSRGTPSKAHVHLINLVVDKGTYRFLSESVAKEFPECGLDQRAGETLFSMYGSGKDYPGRGSKRLEPYLFSWYARLNADGGWTHGKVDLSLVPSLLSLRRPVVDGTDLIFEGLVSPPRNNARRPPLTTRENIVRDDDTSDGRKSKRSRQMIVDPVFDKENESESDDGSTFKPFVTAEKSSSRNRLTKVHKVFAQLIVNSWSEMSADRSEWLRVVAALVNTIHHRDATFCRSLVHNFSRLCPSKYDFYEVDRLYDTMVANKATRKELCYMGHIMPLTKSEMALEREILFRSDATWGRIPWLRAFVKHYYAGRRVVRVRNPVIPDEYVVLKYVESEGVYVVMGIEEIQEEYRKHIQQMVLKLLDKLLCKYFNNVLFETLAEHKKAFNEVNGVIPREIAAVLVGETEIVPDETFDKRRDYMVFDNGVLNLDTGEFGPYDPEIYCMVKNRNVIDFDSPETQEKVQLVKTTLQGIFTDDATLRKFYLWCMKCLIPGNSTWRSFLFLRGDRRNGKSLLLKVLEKTFNSPQLMTTLPADRFKKDPTPLSSHFYLCTGEERVLMLHEFSLINCSAGALELIKSVVGGDKVSYRIPYKNKNTTHEIYGQLWASTNAVSEHFNLLPTSKAIADRVRVFPLTSTFITRQEFRLLKNVANISNYHISNPLLSYRTKDLGEGLINLIVHFYRSLNPDRKPGGIERFIGNEPFDSPLMIRYKTKILQACDVIYQYLKTHLYYAPGNSIGAYATWLRFKKNLDKGDTKNSGTFEQFALRCKEIIVDLGWMGKKMASNFTVDCDDEEEITRRAYFRNVALNDFNEDIL